MQRLKLADNPKVALVAVVHARALDVFYIAARTESVVRIAPTVACLDRSAEGIEESKARTQLEATTKAGRKRLPKDADKLWKPPGRARRVRSRRSRRTPSPRKPRRSWPAPASFLRFCGRRDSGIRLAPASEAGVSFAPGSMRINRPEAATARTVRTVRAVKLLPPATAGAVAGEQYQKGRARFVKRPGSLNRGTSRTASHLVVSCGY